jgi:hypothetical protein
MIHQNRILAATVAAVAALTAPLTVSAQSAPMPSYAHAFARDPFPYARTAAVVPVRHHRRHWPAYRYPAYGYGAFGYYPGYGYPAYGYPVYGYGYPGWYGPSFSVGIGFRFGGCCYGRIGGRRR